jgi:hypothetical protein
MYAEAVAEEQCQRSEHLVTDIVALVVQAMVLVVDDDERAS